MAVFTAWIEQFSDVLWNSLLLFLLVGTGLYFTVRLRGCLLYTSYLVHHVLLTLVFLRFVARFNLPLAGMFPVYLAVSFALAAVLTAVSRPLGKAIKKLA